MLYRICLDDRIGLQILFVTRQYVYVQHVTDEGTALVKQAEDAASNKKVGSAISLLFCYMSELFCCTSFSFWLFISSIVAHRSLFNLFRTFHYCAGWEERHCWSSRTGNNRKAGLVFPNVSMLKFVICIILGVRKGSSSFSKDDAVTKVLGWFIFAWM